MIRRYNLVSSEKLTLPIEEAKQLLKNHCTYGTLQAYLYTPRSCPQKGNWNEFVDRFKLLPIGIQELILQNYMEKKLYGHYKIIFYTLIMQNYVNIKNGY